MWLSKNAERLPRFPLGASVHTLAPVAQKRCTRRAAPSSAVQIVDSKRLRSNAQQKMSPCRVTFMPRAETFRPTFAVRAV
jgi:hypothetical protein